MPDIFSASRLSREEEAANAANSTKSTKTAKTKTRNVNDYSTVMRDEAPGTNPLMAFLAKPENVFFDAQHKDETVILLLRQHPITQIPWILTAIGLALLPFLFAWVPFFDFLPGRFQFAALLGWYALVFSFVLESFLMWFFNIYLITDERIIDIDFQSLIYKNVSSAKIDNIEDVSSITGGALRSVFNFGTIRVQTAGTKNEFEFADVPHPAKVTALLNDLLIEEEQEKLEGRVS